MNLKKEIKKGEKKLFFLGLVDEKVYCRYVGEDR